MNKTFSQIYYNFKILVYPNNNSTIIYDSFHFFYYKEAQPQI